MTPLVVGLSGLVLALGIAKLLIAYVTRKERQQIEGWAAISYGPPDPFDGDQ